MTQIKLNILLFSAILLLLTSCHGQTADKYTNTTTTATIPLQGDTVTTLASSIMLIHQDQNNVYWYGSWNTSVYRYDGETLINYTTKHGLPNNRIDEIKEDRLGNIYFTSCHPASTVTKFDGSRITILAPTPSTEWTLSPTDMWFKHSYGNEKVYRYDGKTLHELTLPQPLNLDNPFEIYSIYKDKNGYIWFGTNPVGACRYDGSSFRWITEDDVTEFRNEGANGVRSIAEDPNGDFWFNTEYRYSINDSANSDGDKFYTQHQSIGSLDGEENGGLDEYLSTVKDDDDNLWFVTYMSGVWKYDGTVVTHYPVQENSTDIKLFSIYKDNSGHLWLGTHENGLYKYNGQTFEPFVP